MMQHNVNTKPAEVCVDAARQGEGVDALAALREVLTEEIRQTEAIVAVLEEKRRILVSGKPPHGLLEVDRALVSFAQRSAQLEACRRELICALSGFVPAGVQGPVATAASEPTLGSLISVLPPENRAEFTRLRDQLLRAAHDVECLNRNNRELLNMALRWIHDTVETIAAALTPEAATYDARARKRNFGNTGAAAPPGALPQSTISHSA